MIDNQLDFTVTADGIDISELIPHGAETSVTDANKLRYTDLLRRHHLLGALNPCLWHLLQGLYQAVPPDLLAAFDCEELEVRGTSKPVRAGHESVFKSQLRDYRTSRCATDTDNTTDNN